MTRLAGARRKAQAMPASQHRPVTQGMMTAEGDDPPYSCLAHATSQHRPVTQGMMTRMRRTLRQANQGLRSTAPLRRG